MGEEVVAKTETTKRCSRKLNLYSTLGGQCIRKGKVALTNRIKC